MYAVCLMLHRDMMMCCYNLKYDFKDVGVCASVEVFTCSDLNVLIFALDRLEYDSRYCGGALYDVSSNSK